jgi:hypothetical protein
MHRPEMILKAYTQPLATPSLTSHSWPQRQGCWCRESSRTSWYQPSTRARQRYQAGSRLWEATPLDHHTAFTRFSKRTVPQLLRMIQYGMA